MGVKVLASIGTEKYHAEVTAGENKIITDEPLDKGGQNKGLNPFELLAASLELEALKTQQQRPTNRPKPVLRPGAAPVDESTRVASMDAAHEAALRRGRVVPTK